MPAALAVAEFADRSGADFLRAVALGYDIGTRFNMSLGYPNPNAATHSTHTLGVNFGAAAAAAALLRFDPVKVRYVMSYAVQQASGCPYWYRDSDHVEKAFDFGGMGARNGVAGAMMVHSGMTGVEEPFTGQGNFFDGFALKANPDIITDALGQRFEVMEASIKKWCVGSPIQSVLDATQALIDEHGVKPANAKRVVITMPDDRMHIVNNGHMPDVCVQHLVAMSIVDGTVDLRERARPRAHGRSRGAGGAQERRTRRQLRADGGEAGAAGHRRGRARRRPQGAPPRRGGARHARQSDDHQGDRDQGDRPGRADLRRRQGAGPGEGDRRPRIAALACASCGRCCRLSRLTYPAPISRTGHRPRTRL